MSEFKLVQRAQFSPTVCTFCGAHEGPFIDTHVDLPIHGHIYVCGPTDQRSGCARQIGQLAGLVHPDIYEQLDALTAERERLENQLHQERKQKTASIEAIREALHA